MTNYGYLAGYRPVTANFHKKRGDDEFSAYNRYVFLKKLHKRDLIIIKRKNKYFSFSYDAKILKLIKFKNSFKIFDKYQINYKVIDNLEIIKNKNFDNNYYKKYLYIVKIRQILDKLLSNI